ncbi:energy-coupling factor transporter transmembrane component T family protein [Actinomyces vulturis]|uniref:energy-coupling factor transporter transmembrane component T family protein n=1 Tax=Actinomyces vulturis TaxID=1857645 RepID=UPI00159EE6F8|nr:energy-coupling factor transporter transmembrane component T [Actinomyces vulturis]
MSSLAFAPLSKPVPTTPHHQWEQNLRTSWKPVRYLRNDPRNTLLLVFITNICVMGGASTPVLIVAAFIAGVLFASVCSLRGLFIYISLVTLFIVFTTHAAVIGQSAILAFFISMSFWMSRFTITTTLGIYALYSISPTQLASALRSMRLPRSFVNAVLVMLRFIPTIIAEFRAIQAAMRLRGIRLTGRDTILHPIRTVEYLLVPLMAGIIRIADDLTASAVIRGMGAREIPLPLIALRWRIGDVVVISAVIALLVLRWFNPGSIPDMNALHEAVIAR